MQECLKGSSHETQEEIRNRMLQEGQQIWFGEQKLIHPKITYIATIGLLSGKKVLWWDREQSPYAGRVLVIHGLLGKKSKFKLGKGKKSYRGPPRPSKRGEKKLNERPGPHPNRRRRKSW